MGGPFAPGQQKQGFGLGTNRSSIWLVATAKPGFAGVLEVTRMAGHHLERVHDFRFHGQGGRGLLFSALFGT